MILPKEEQTNNEESIIKQKRRGEKCKHSNSVRVRSRSQVTGWSHRLFSARTNRAASAVWQ